MTIRLYTNDELESFRTVPKKVTNPRARWSEKPSKMPVHLQRSFKAVGTDNDQLRFEIYQRQNLLDESDYSCGIAYISLDGSRLTLARYNGPGHEHGHIVFQTHIHRASAEAIASGKKPEREAEETDRYVTLEGALACLIEDYGITGIQAERDQPRLL